MRTTITLDPDVEALVKKTMKERGLSFKETVNESLRSALTTPRRRASFRTPTYSMGEPKIPLDHALRVAADLEDEEIMRRMRAGK